MHEKSRQPKRQKSLTLVQSRQSVKKSQECFPTHLRMGTAIINKTNKRGEEWKAQGAVKKDVPTAYRPPGTRPSTAPGLGFYKRAADFYE